MTPIARLQREVEGLRRERDEARRDADKMRAFCNEALAEFWEGDGSMQDMGERHGLLIPTLTEVPCGEACSCAEYGADSPTDCYKFAPFLKSHPDSETQG